MRPRVSVILRIVVLALAVASPARADLLYTYSGPIFGHGGVDPGWATGIYSLDDHITGTVLIREDATATAGCGPAGCGVDLLDPDAVLAYSFTAGGGELISDANSTIAQFAFAYDGYTPGALPMDWIIGLHGADRGLQMVSSFDNGEQIWVGGSSRDTATSAAGHWVYNYGTWTVQHVPEPATWFLFGLGLLGIAALRPRMQDQSRPSHYVARH